MATTNYRKPKTSTWNKTRTQSSSGWKTTKMSHPGRANYTNLKHNFQNKISSYRTLYNEMQGTAGKGRPPAATLNTFGNWINKGAVIQKVSAAQINRWSNTDRKCTTSTAARNVLYHKFGKAPIKAVCKTKSGAYIVATAPMYRGKNFKFPR